jgi:hypothetical protein
LLLVVSGASLISKKLKNMDLTKKRTLWIRDPEKFIPDLDPGSGSDPGEKHRVPD